MKNAIVGEDVVVVFMRVEMGDCCCGIEVQVGPESAARLPINATW